MATITQKISKSLRTDIEKKINRLPMWFTIKIPRGISSRASQTMWTSLGQNLNTSLTTLVAAVTMLGGSLIMMFITNWIMALTAVGSVLIGFVMMMVIMKNPKKHFDGQQKYLGKSTVMWRKPCGAYGRKSIQWRTADARGFQGLNKS